jgi:hypothetical protein
MEDVGGAGCIAWKRCKSHSKPQPALKQALARAHPHPASKSCRTSMHIVQRCPRDAVG